MKKIRYFTFDRSDTLFGFLVWESNSVAGFTHEGLGFKLDNSTYEFCVLNGERELSEGTTERDADSFYRRLENMLSSVKDKGQSNLQSQRA